MQNVVELGGGQTKLPRGGELKHKRFVLQRTCPYNPTTFVDDCLNCNQRCIPLQQIMPEEFELNISKQLRDKIYEYLFGENNPLIQLRELTGIPLRVDIRRDDPVMTPEKIAYLQDLSQEDYRKHWRLYFKGFYIMRAMGELQQAGFIIESLPQDTQELAAYYRAHYAIMRGQVKPEDVLDKFDISKMSDAAANQVEFNSKGEAIKIMLSKALDLMREGGYDEYSSQIQGLADEIKAATDNKQSE